MLHALSGTDQMDLLLDQLVQSVPAIGASMIEPARRGYAESDDPTFRDSAYAILTEVSITPRR